MKVGSYKPNLLEMFSDKLKIDDTGVQDTISVKGSSVGANSPVFSHNGEMESTKLAFEEFLKQKKEIAMKQEKSMSQKDRMCLKLNEKENPSKSVLNQVTNAGLHKGDKSNDTESRLRRNMHKPYSNRHSRCTGTEEENGEGVCVGHCNDPCDHVEAKKCDCTYCAVFGTVHKNAELRDRLRVRLHQRREKRSKDVNKQNLPVNSNGLKPKSVAANRVETRVPLPSSPTNIPSAPSISSTDSLGNSVEIPLNSDIHGILNYIEGNTALNKQELAEKKAAKKARQRAKREQEKVEAEEEEKRKLEELRKKEEERQREIERKLLEKKKLEAAMKKKEKKRKQQIKRQGGVEVLEETVPAVVTIKRTADDNVKPTLVITLKGCTPDQETLLCTLVNDKCEISNEDLTKGKKKKNGPKVPDERLIVSKDIDITVAVDKSSSRKNVEVPAFEKQHFVSAAVQKNKPNQKNARKISSTVDVDEMNALGNLRLPPGITITKVEGPVSNRTYLSSDPPKSTPSAVSKSGVIVVDTEQLTNKPGKESHHPQQPGSCASTTNTKTSRRSRNRKNKNKNPESAQQLNNSDRPKMVTLKNPIFQQYQPTAKPPDNNVDACAPAAIFTSENGMVTIRSSRLQQSLESSPDSQQPKTTVPNVWKNPTLLNPSEPWANGTFTNPNPYFPEMSSSINVKDVPVENTVASAKDAQEILSGLPGIEITKLDKNCVPSEKEALPVCPEAQVTLYPPLNGADIDLDELQFDKDDWLYDSVFKPRDVLEDDMDPEELELEAFKRFCSQSVPPKQKEKVAHLNVADIFWKKETDVKFT